VDVSLGGPDLGGAILIMANLLIPAPGGYPRLCYGWDGTDWRALLVDAAGELQVHIAGQYDDLGVVQTDPSQMLVGAHGWDGAVWRKQPIGWGYSDTYQERIDKDNVPAGDVTVNFTAVADGEVWVVCDVFMLSRQANYTIVTLSVRSGGTNYNLTIQGNPGAWRSAEFHGNVVMKEGDFIRAVYSGAALNDDFITCVTGYKMGVAL